MNDLVIGVTFVEAEDGKVDVWFHLPDSEGEVTEMAESFIAGTFTTFPLAKQTVINTGSLLIRYMNKGKLIR